MEDLCENNGCVRLRSPTRRCKLVPLRITSPRQFYCSKRNRKEIVSQKLRIPLSYRNIAPFLYRIFSLQSILRSVQSMLKGINLLCFVGKPEPYTTFLLKKSSKKTFNQGFSSNRSYESDYIL